MTQPATTLGSTAAPAPRAKAARSRSGARLAKELLHRVLVVIASVALTAVFFLVLPLIQAITKPPTADLLLHEADAPSLPPPPPPIEEEPEKEPEPEEEPPELVEDVQPLDLSMLELALDPGVGDGWFDGDFGVSLNLTGLGPEGMDDLLDGTGVDQEARPIHQPPPVLNAAALKKKPGTVNMRFTVDERGRVAAASVDSSTDPVFEKPALAAVKQWRFEPAKRKGVAVESRFTIPIVFK